MAKANFITVTYLSLSGRLIAFQIQALPTFITDWLTHFKANKFIRITSKLNTLLRTNFPSSQNSPETSRKGFAIHFVILERQLSELPPGSPNSVLKEHKVHW